MEAMSDAALAGLLGAGGGVMLGMAARVGRFCTLGAIEDAFLGGDYRRLRMWALALAVAILGVAVLNAGGAVDIAASSYLTTHWNPVASIAGGLAFGYGMALVGTCGFGALARLGGGDMRGLVVVMVMGVFAYGAAGGFLSGARRFLFPVEPLGSNDRAPTVTDAIAAVAPESGWMAAVAVSLALTAWALREPAFRRSANSLFWGVVVGLAIVSGWASTGWLAQFGFEPVEPSSHSFTAPLGESLLFAMTSTAAAPSFAVGSVGGVILGASLGALLKSEFRWEACDDARELRRQILGAALMGVGGVVAVGCTVGQGLTAFSVLAFSAPVALASIFAGAWLGLHQLVLGVNRSIG